MFKRPNDIRLATIYVTFVVCIVAMFGVYRLSLVPATTQLTLDLEVETISSPRAFFIGYPVTSDDVECLALNIYHEARGEEPDGMYAVADVVMYRVMHYDFPDTVCSVVKAGIYSPWSPDIPNKWQCSFTWFCDRESDIPKEPEAYAAAEYVARQVLFDEEYVPVVSYALYYHADYVYPAWAPGKTVVARVGNHIYYM